MPGEPEVKPGSDLATMLAEMDSRLQQLQQELEAVALPIARSPTEQLRTTKPGGTAIPASEPPPREEPADPPLPAPPTARTAGSIEDELLSTPPRRPARRVSASSRSAAPPPAAEPAPPPEQAPSPRIGRGRSAEGHAGSSPRPSGAPVVRRPAVASARTEPTAPEAVVRQTILEAEEEARRVVEDARQRIAEIGARTRALLEHSLHEPSQPAAAPSPRRRRARAVKAARRAYEGTVIVEAGPFADVGQLGAFEDALASIPSVDDVYIRTFESNRAHFEVNVTAATALIVELQARAADTLNVLAAGDSELRLDIVRAPA